MLTWTVQFYDTEAAGDFLKMPSYPLDLGVQQNGEVVSHPRAVTHLLLLLLAALVLLLLLNDTLVATAAAAAE